MSTSLFSAELAKATNTSTAFHFLINKPVLLFLVVLFIFIGLYSIYKTRRSGALKNIKADWQIHRNLCDTISHNDTLQLETILKEHNVNFEAVDSRTGWKPVLLASSLGRDDCLKCLFRHGASATSYNDTHGTALHLAVQQNNHACVRVLMKTVLILR